MDHRRRPRCRLTSSAPLAAGLADAFIAIFVDLSDLFLRDWIDLRGVEDYQRFDKVLDRLHVDIPASLAKIFHE